MKKFTLVVIIFLVISIPVYNADALHFCGLIAGQSSDDIKKCWESQTQMICSNQLLTVCANECKNSAASSCDISSSDCYKNCKAREDLRSQSAANTDGFYEVSKSDWFNYCLGTDSVVGNKINGLGFVKISSMVNKYNYVFADIDKEILKNKSYYDDLLKKEANVAQRVTLNNERKTKDKCLNDFKTEFNEMLKQKKYKCYNTQTETTDLSKASNSVSGACQIYNHFLAIYQEAHDSLCPVVDLYNSVKIDIVNMSRKNADYSAVGCAAGYSYDQCNLTCASSAPSYLLELTSGQLVKNKQYAEVFYVDNNLCLHWIINEKVAAKHYGTKWNKNIKEYDQISGYKFCDNIK